MSGRRGNITRRGERSWRIKFEKGRDPETGERLIGYKTVRGAKKDAQQELTRLLGSLDSGTYVDPTSMTVGEFLTKWLDIYARPSVSQKTCERYSQIVNDHLIPNLGAAKLGNLSPIQIQEYLSEAAESGHRQREGGLSPRTVHHLYAVLSTALKKAVKWRLIQTNPADAVDPPSAAQAEIQILLGDELTKLFQAAKPSRYYSAIVLAAGTGMRRGEVLGLSWRDVDLDGASLTVNHSLEEVQVGLRLKEPKSKNSRRAIDLPQFVVVQLRRHRATQAQERLILGMGGAGQDDYIFTTIDGGPIRPRNFTNEFSRLVEKAGVRRASLHSLRHTHATQLLRDGVNVKVVSERLGHSTIAITLQLYGHVLPTMQAEAVAALDAAFGANLGD